MNERIKELAEQFWNERLEGQLHFDNEKFAELVIRECGYLADVFNALGCPDDMDLNDTKPSDYIKRYFGVEDEPR